MESIYIDLDILKRHNLTVQEYMTLFFIYWKDKGDITSDIFGPLLSYNINSLNKKAFIKIVDKSNIELREKGNLLFQSEKDYFLEWLGKFPIKTPSGRYLGTQDPSTILGKALRKKWNSLFKNKPLLEKRAIEVLEAEMEWRRKTGKFEFMHNAKTWLHQGDFQNYYYLIKDKQKVSNKLKEDFT